MIAEVAVRERGRIDRRVGVLAVVWLAAAGPLAAMLLLGATGPDRFPVPRGVLHAAYALALVSYLACRGPSLPQLPESPLGNAANTLPGRLATTTAALVLCLVGLLDAGLFMLVLVVVALVLAVTWRRQLTLRAGVLGLVASALAFLASGITFWRHNFVAKPMLVLMLVAIPPMFVAAGMLVARTGLGAVRVLEGRYGAAARSFLAGVVLFAPLGLANAASRARFGPAWVDQWWQPLVLPVWSGIVEEVVFRAVLVCLLFALLQPALKRAPGAGIATAVLVSAIVFGLGHGQTVDNLLSAGLGFGLPMAVIFVRRDWEHAVGAHYMVNFVPWLMALLAR